MANVEYVSHYLYGCEPQYVVDISMKLYATHVIFVDFLKLWKKNVQWKYDSVIHNI